MMGKKPVLDIDIEEGTTIIQLVEKLFGGKYSRPLSSNDRRLNSSIMIFVNKEEIREANLDIILNAGDEVTIYPS